MSWPTSNPISREIDDFWKESQSLWQQAQYEMDIDIKMYTGQVDSLNNLYGFSNQRNNRTLQFNKILRILNMIQGYQIDNRLATIVIPSDNDKDMGHTADQLTKMLSWVMRQDQTYEKISETFNASNVCGLNLFKIWMDFREDPENGKICTTRLPFSSFLIDNYWQNPDLSDATRILTRDYLSKAQLLSIFPKIEKDLPSLGRTYASKDGKFQFMPQNWTQYQQNMYTYDEYWVRSYKTTRKLMDKSTGEVVDWKGTREQFQMMRRYNPNIDLIKASVPTVKMYVLVNNQLMYEEDSPYGLDRFPFVPSLCYFTPEVQNYAYRHFGVVRNIRDSQMELNRRRNRLLDIMDAQIQSGLMVKEDALVNPEDAFFQGPGKILFFKQSSNLASDVAPIPPPPVAQGWMELIQTIEKEIMDIVGPEELFAQNMGAKEMTGVLMKLKMGAGLTGLRNIFDRLNQFQTFIGDIMLDLAQKNFSVGHIENIIGQEPSQHFRDPMMTKYHCAVEEGELTSTQRQLQFLQTAQLKQMGIPISNSYLLEKSTLQGKKELIEDIQKQEQQAQQMQQAQMQLELEQKQIMTRSLEAKAQADFSSAIERKARAVSDIALAKERTSQAVHDRAAAALDNAKALKEIDELDDNRLMKLADFILNIQERQKALEGGEEEDSMERASELSSEIQNTKQVTKPDQQKQKEAGPSQLQQAIGE